MKVSKQRAAENRDAILDVAARKIRERGFEQMSVADVAKDAGLTHGALYSHFRSKEALQAAALHRAFEESAVGFAGLSPKQFLDRYLSPEHRDNVGGGCPTAALVSEMRWQSEEARAAFHDGLNGFAALMRRAVRSSDTDDEALFAFSAMVGGLAIARAIRNQDEAASDAVLRSVAERLHRMLLQDAPEPGSAAPG